MKDPKDMTREELADDIGMIADPYIQEAATRLRNSIDRPEVEALKIDGAWYTVINGEPYWHEDEDGAVYLCHFIITNLGMEGGEG